MGAAVKEKKDIGYRVFLAGLAIVLLVLSRYVVNGEPVDVRSDEAEITTALPLYDGIEIRQPLHITEEMNWRQGYYALFFAECDRNSIGQLICTLEQGAEPGSVEIELREMEQGAWLRLGESAFGKLEGGEAVLHIRTRHVAEGELAVAAGPDYYGFGVVDYNGTRQEVTLAQAYHYHITGMEYAVRLLCFGVVALCMAGLALLIPGRRIGESRKCLISFGIMTVMFMAVLYLLDSSLYLEPTYAEAVTNFLQYARGERLVTNLLMADAGYLPLLPRLITLFYIKVLRLPSEYALYFMQTVACLLCSMIWAFFVLHPFHEFMRLSNRILWCMLVMLSCFCEETLFFTNHAYWGIYLLLLLLVVDLERFPGWIYTGLLGMSALICLSKGTYVIMLPLMILYLVFFRRSVGKRDRIFAFVVGAASLLQLLYSFGGQGDGGIWIDTAAGEGGQLGHWFRLAGRVFVEFGAYLLAPAGRAVQHIPGPVFLLGLAVFVFLTAGFTGMVLLPLIKGKAIDRRRAAFYTVVIFQLMVSAFYLVTVKQVPAVWKDMGQIGFQQMGHKYEIFSNMGFYMLLLTAGGLCGQNKTGVEFKTADVYQRRWQTGFVRGLFGRYGVVALLCAFCVTNPVMRLSGWADAAVSDSRVYAKDINTGWWECREMLAESAFFIPVRADHWGYSSNVTVYQVGTDIYFEEAPCVNLEETADGYHSMYTLPKGEHGQKVLEVMIERPARIDLSVCRAQLLDAEGSILAEAEQIGGGRYKKCLFRFAQPADGAETIRFVDGNGQTVYYKDYIAWVCAW